MSDNIDPVHRDFSRLAAGAYDQGGNRSTHTSNTNYMLHPNAAFSDHSITTYVSKNDPRHIVIAHRGTAPGSKGGRQDIGTDLALAGGFAGERKRMKDRQRKTEQIIKSVNPTTLHLTGHSLGGSTVNHTIANSRLVRSKLTSAHTFNAGHNPLAANKLTVNRRAAKRLEGKVVHHRIGGDAVSAGLTASSPFGTVRTYNKKRTTGQRLLAAVSPFTGIANRALDTHGIHNFHGG